MCKYRTIFGKEREGLHAYRIFDIAVVDVIFTVLAAILLSWWWHIPFVVILLVLFLMGIFMHWLFCVDTTVNRWLFGKFHFQ